MILKLIMTFVEKSTEYEYDTSLITNFLEKTHMQNIKEFVNPSNWIDYAILCTATSINHIDAIIHKIKNEFGKKYVQIYGTSKSEWVIMNFQNCIIHVFTQEKRNYYNLDEIFENIRIK